MECLYKFKYPKSLKSQLHREEKAFIMIAMIELFPKVNQQSLAESLQREVSSIQISAPKPYLVTILTHITGGFTSTYNVIFQMQWQTPNY